MKYRNAFTRAAMLPVIALAVMALIATVGYVTPGHAEDAAATAATLKIEEHPEYGQYLTDAEGRALYLFKADSENESTCYEGCADAWPPLLTEGEPVAGDDAVKSDLIDTITRRGGEIQVTYNGWPLYYFIRDEGPGEVKGQDVMGFGAEWYLLTPSGEEVHGDEEGEDEG